MRTAAKRHSQTGDVAIVESTGTNHSEPEAVTLKKEVLTLSQQRESDAAQISKLTDELDRMTLSRDRVQHRVSECERLLEERDSEISDMRNQVLASEAKVKENSLQDNGKMNSPPRVVDCGHSPIIEGLQEQIAALSLKLEATEKKLLISQSATGDLGQVGELRSQIQRYSYYRYIVIQ